MNELLNTPLSERELEILRLVAQGKANKEIAAELFISVNTVKVHLAKIFHRIGVASRTEATLYAIEHEHVENPNHSLVNPQDQQVESRVELVVPETVTVERAIVKLSLGEIIRKFWWAFGIGLLVLASFTVAWDKGWIFPKPTPDPILAAMNEDRWKELAPMSVARANMAVTVYDNKIYVIGGETEEGVTGLTEVYDIATDTWARLPDKPTPVTNAKAVVVGGKIYVIGSLDVDKAVIEFSSFEPQSGIWDNLTTISSQYENNVPVAFEGKIFSFSYSPVGMKPGCIYTYDPDYGKWNVLTTFSQNIQINSVIVDNQNLILVSNTDGVNNTVVQLPIQELPYLDDYLVNAIPFPPQITFFQSLWINGTVNLYSIEDGDNLRVSSYDWAQKTWFGYSEKVPFRFSVRILAFPIGNFTYIFNGLDFFRYRAVYTLLLPIVEN
jgi:DNA-binding CsgD family transcriptional regulator